MPSAKEILEKARNALKNKEGGSNRDPHEWRSPKNVSKKMSFKFVILPPLEKGEKAFGGRKNDTEMDGLPFYKGGTHWVNKRPYECPRIHDGEKCDYCQTAFDLFEETTDKKQRTLIAKKYLPSETYAVNIYFPPYPNTDPDIADRVFFAKFGQRNFINNLSECIRLDEDDALGDTPEENRAWGLFYLAERMYVYAFNIKEKGGYNNYDDSKFLVSTLGSLKEILGRIDPKLGTDEKVEEILSQRHDLGSKYDDRDPEAIKRLLDHDTEEEDSGFDDSDEESYESGESSTHSAEESDSDSESDDKSDEQKAKLEKARSSMDDDDELRDLLNELQDEDAPY